MPGHLNASEFDLREYLLILLRRKWIVLGSTVILGVLAFAYSEVRPAVYSCSAKVLIQRPSSSTLFDPSNAQRINTDLLAEIELQFYEGDAVKKAAQDKLGYQAVAPASASGRGSVMTISANSGDPQKCSDIANRYAESYIEVRRKSSVDDFAATAQAIQTKIDDVDKQLGEVDANASATTTTVAPFPGARPVPTTAAGSASNVAERESLTAQKEALEKSLSQLQVGQQNASASGPQIITPAKVPTAPSSPNVKRDTLLGFIVGFLLGIALAFLIDFLDDSIKNRNDLEMVMGDTPILAIIPFAQDWRNREEAHLISLEDPGSPTAEAYRTLRTAVQFAGLERPLHCLQVTSPRSKDGKTTTSSNLAVALARAGMRVILVDCDLRRPRVHDFLHTQSDIGFTSVLLGDTPLENAVQRVEGVPYLRFLASGPIPPNPSELLSGRKAGELVETLKASADMVIFDTPPVLPVSDALVLSDLTDAVIMVVAAGSTTRNEAHRAYELLAQVEAPLIGTVLNSGSSQRGYGYSYGYSQASYSQPAPRSKKGSSMRGGKKATSSGNGSTKANGTAPKVPVADGATSPAAGTPTSN